MFLLVKPNTFVSTHYSLTPLYYVQIFFSSFLYLNFRKYVHFLRRISKRVLNGNFHATRPVGRPSTRWANVVQRNALQLLWTREWGRRATNRDEWMRLVREAKVRNGL
jgi:hypothetical protein